MSEIVTTMTLEAPIETTETLEAPIETTMTLYCRIHLEAASSTSGGGGKFHPHEPEP